MRESYGEGIASRTGPKPCADGRKVMGEASAGAPAGRVLSRERYRDSRCRRRPNGRKATSAATLLRVAGEPCAVKDLGHAWQLPAGTWEVPRLAVAKMGRLPAG